LPCGAARGSKNLKKKLNLQRPAKAITPITLYTS
jgi:hypothetical protein